MSRPLRAYMVGEKDGDWAMLVFAHTAQEARKVSYGTGWHEPCEMDDWTLWQAKWIRNLPSILWELSDGTVQVIDSPPTCETCERWGGEPMGRYCSHCYEGRMTCADLQINDVIVADSGRRWKVCTTPTKENFVGVESISKTSRYTIFSAALPGYCVAVERDGRTIWERHAGVEKEATK